VSLSSNIDFPGIPEAAGFLVIDVPVKVGGGEDGEETVLDLVSCSGAEELVERVIDRSRPVRNWLLYRIPREFCPDGSHLTLSALAGNSVLWQAAYTVVWRDRLPVLELGT
jgi:hypothetical protein